MRERDRRRLAEREPSADAVREPPEPEQAPDREAADGEDETRPQEAELPV
jgi:hypothetical protein